MSKINAKEIKKRIDMNYINDFRYHNTYMYYIKDDDDKYVIEFLINRNLKPVDCRLQPLEDKIEYYSSSDKYQQTLFHESPIDKRSLSYDTEDEYNSIVNTFDRFEYKKYGGITHYFNSDSLRILWNIFAPDYEFFVMIHSQYMIDFNFRKKSYTLSMKLNAIPKIFDFSIYREVKDKLDESAYTNIGLLVCVLKIFDENDNVEENKCFRYPPSDPFVKVLSVDELGKQENQEDE